MYAKFKFLSSLCSMITNYIIPLALGVSLSACCGFRIFIPLLIASVAAKFGGLHLSSGFEWMGTLPAMIAFITASVIEIAAYYIPVLDNFLDTLSTPSAIVAGTVISASVFVDFDPMLKWTLAIIAGGGTAGIIQAGTGLLRLGSTKLTVGSGNVFLATSEMALSFFGTIFSLVIPVIMALVFTALVIGILFFFIKKIKKAVN